MPLAAALAALLLAAPAAALPTPDEWQNAGFGRPLLTRVELESVYRGVRSGPPRGRLTVHALLLRGGDWTRAQAEAQLRRTAGVFAQCGLMLDAAELVEADAPGGRLEFVKYQADGPGSMKQLIERMPLKARPVYYLIQGWEDIDDDRAWSAAGFEEGNNEDPAVWDSVFLPSGVNAPAYEEERRASPYTVAAHELLHVLTRIGSHYNEEPRHLLNIWRTRSDAVRADHCERVLSHPLVRPGP